MRIRAPLLACALAAGACSVPSAAAPPAPVHAPQELAPDGGGREELEDLVRRFTGDRRALERFHWIALSEQRRARLAAFDAEWRGRLEALDYDALGPEARIDWHLLRRALDEGAAERELEQRRLDEMDALLSFRAPLIALEEERWRVAPLDPRAAATLLARLADEVRAVEERVRPARGSGDGDVEADEPAPQPPEDGRPAAGEAQAEGAPPLEVGPVLALRAAKALDELARVLATWYEHHDAYRPDFSWWVERPRADLDEALAELTKRLRVEIARVEGEDDDPLVGDPLGREALERAIAGELLAYSPEELLAIGERELAWCEGEMARAAAELGAADWRAALEQVKQSFVPPGEQDALVAGLADEVLRFLDERELVTVDELCRETWRVEMLDRREQRVLPFAAYGGQKVLVAYATEDMDQGEKLMSLRGNNEHFTRIVTPHELIPGHHLQGYMSARHAEHRQAFSTPFYGEGWALHWEMLLWDLGWARGPEDRIGMLFWRMHRAARILVSLRFHLGLMQPQEMVDFLVERVGHERENATGEVRRFVGDSYGPLYQCAYMIGGLQLRALHREVVERDDRSPRAFHDEVLRSGPIPIELVRARLLGLELPRDWRPSWRFAD